MFGSGKGEQLLFNVADFNGAFEYFETTGSERWDEIATVVDELRPQFQASDQAGRVGGAIFDPKATNRILTDQAADFGWSKVPVPAELKPFGLDWDGGKGTVLAEWQFSNYPFLWNNVIRTEAIFQSEARLPSLSGPVDALIIITKSGTLPASNSTLYFEQACAQIDTVTTLGVFRLPIRIIGLTVDTEASALDIDWNSYDGRYARDGISEQRVMNVTWGNPRQYGHRSLSLS